MSLPETIVTAALELAAAMMAADNKRTAQAQYTLRRRVEAERIRATAVATVATPPVMTSVKVGRFISAEYAKPKTRKSRGV